MAETTLQPNTQSNSALPAYMFKDPVLTFFTLPILPFILFVQSINNMIMPNQLQLPQQQQTASSYYKNDETWLISEDKNGDIKIKVQRIAKR